MNIIDELKKAMNWDKLDEATAKEIVNDLEAGIEKMKQEQELEKIEAKSIETKAWTDKLAEARAKQHNIIARKKKHKQLSGISAGRLAMLRKLGKIDD